MTELDIDVPQLINNICEQLKQKPMFKQAPKMIGIRTGGEWVAQKIHQQLELTDELGVIDIAFYRDDFSKIGLNPTVKPSHIPWDVDNQHIILVDDVLYTGRTTRAALNEIFDFGRPASVTLVTLLDRKGCRELPFQADITGESLECSQTIKLTGPDPLKVTILENSEETA
ncbi:bifunctional pyr operon transcriptional regulator/uracil phosphoribosyltransferase PyrR [Thiomicrorhabdus lithotrophica]|uniref:Bifunctional pyr operon transcriptional regulator/uracil phosphoribosyltransferase PyrR n=1 Tax=Thiomicrorhabdus lithotrophica TaxID=2949997 RepID=A0ABY8CD32_9GAMM|nr:bifunctional pyr operon transcriptional regulator/uracil phosphoribosyltransferase PyrR [Thiomicrorhabdus lithotrophica]WEJ62323.1 bifunctional pyr operon transcriptional regulator/uracil phosphoribosyltransferase PyrR [Thiomicrorhabdus lithotrophica]